MNTKGLAKTTLDGILESIKDRTDIDIVLLHNIDVGLIEGMSSTKFSIEGIKTFNKKIFACTERLTENELERMTDIEVFDYNGKMIITTNDLPLLRSLVRVFKNVMTTLFIQYLADIDDYMISDISELHKDRIETLGAVSTESLETKKRICVASRQLNNVFTGNDISWMVDLDTNEAIDHGTKIVIKYAKTKGIDFLVNKAVTSFGEEFGKKAKSFLEKF